MKSLVYLSSTALFMLFPPAAKAGNDDSALAVFRQSDVPLAGAKVLASGIQYSALARYLDLGMAAALRGHPSFAAARDDEYFGDGLASFNGMMTADPMLHRVVAAAERAEAGDAWSHWGYLSMSPRRVSDALLMHDVFVGFIVHHADRFPEPGEVRFMGPEACRRAAVRKSIEGQAHYLKHLEISLTSGRYSGLKIYPRIVTVEPRKLLASRLNGHGLPGNGNLRLSVCANTAVYFEPSAGAGGRGPRTERRRLK